MDFAIHRIRNEIEARF